MRIKVLLGLRHEGRDANAADPIGEVFFRIVRWPMKVPIPGKEGATMLLQDSESMREWADAYFGENRWDYVSKHVSPEMIEAAF